MVIELKNKKKIRRKKPIISIITVVLNGEKHLEECFESLYKQKYTNIEHIVIDGGSTDRSIEIIKANENKLNIGVKRKTMVSMMHLI